MNRKDYDIALENYRATLNAFTLSIVTIFASLIFIGNSELGLLALFVDIVIFSALLQKTKNTIKD